MNLPWKYELKEGERANPVLFSTKVELPEGFVYPTDEMMLEILKLEGRPQLRAWGRTTGTRTLDPHWIATRASSPLHNDLPYPRYSHHLKVRVDETVYSRGLDKKGLMLERGTFYILDTHSPHQVFTENPNAYNVSISMDADEMLEPEKAIKMLIDYGLTHDFVPKQ